MNRSHDLGFWRGVHIDGKGFGGTARYGAMVIQRRYHEVIRIGAQVALAGSPAEGTLRPLFLGIWWLIIRVECRAFNLVVP